MDMEIDAASAAQKPITPLKLTRFSEATETYYIYLTVYVPAPEVSFWSALVVEDPRS